jgi:hypothetical protein
MPYEAMMNRKGINREAAAHFIERLDWMVSQSLHLHYAPGHNDGCVSLVQRDPSVSFDGVFVYRAILPPQWMLANLEVASALGRPRLGARTFRTGVMSGIMRSQNNGS